jgi:ribbon-helix-helix CopG family protein
LWQTTRTLLHHEGQLIGLGHASGQKNQIRIHFCHMSSTVTVRLPEDLADWLRENARRRGLSQSQIIKDHLEKARNGAPSRAFMSLAGTIDGPKDLSQRKGFKRP